MATTKTYKRASDVVQGIGANLKDIAGQDVLLVRFSVAERPFEGETRTITVMDLALDPSKPDETQVFHIWSDTFAERIAEISNDDLPLLITFEQVSTRRGQQAWTFR